MPQESSDRAMLDLLRRERSLTISELVSQIGVTATAVRQRIARLMADGLIERKLQRRERGRPVHRYSLTEKGLRSGGTNYDDLASALWTEIRAVKSPEVRRGLLQRIASILSKRYAKEVQGNTLAERMESLQDLMAEREAPLTVNQSGALPVLSALACPYPDLAQQDRGVCAMERLMYSEVLGASLALTECRLDGDHCCTFEAK